MAAVAEASGPDAVAAVAAVVAADPGSDASRAGKRRRSRKGCNLTKSTRRAKEELYGHEIAHDIQETPKRTRPPGKAAGQGCPAGRTQAGERSGSWGRFVGRGLGLGRRFDRGWRRRSGTSRAIRRQRPASRGVRDRKDLEGGLQSARGFSPASAGLAAPQPVSRGIGRLEGVTDQETECSRASSVSPASDFCLLYCAKAFSIAAVTSGSSGLTFDSKRATIAPSLPIKNLVKFHLISPPVDFVRYSYSGAISEPFTEIFAYIGNVTLYLRVQKVLISSFVPGSCAPKLLAGKPATTNPWSLYFS